MVWCVFPVRSEEWRMKNRPSNSTACSDSAQALVRSCGGQIRLRTSSDVFVSFSIWGCVLTGCVERGMFWRAKPRLKGIGDFNLERCFQLIHRSRKKIGWHHPFLHNVSPCGSNYSPVQRCVEIFEHDRSKILVFPSPAGYMLWSFGFSLLIWDIFHRSLLNDQ